MILFLIGYRGCGKTTIGRMLATRMDCDWVDSDQEIRERTGREISEIFESEGEDAFRIIERAMIALLIDQYPSDDASKVCAVFSLGGGAVTDDPTRYLVHHHGLCIWLKASPEVLMQRLSEDPDPQQRPPLTELQEAEEIVQMLERRQPVYAECADYTFDTSRFQPDQIVDQIAQCLQRVDKA